MEQRNPPSSAAGELSESSRHTIQKSASQESPGPLDTLPADAIQAARVEVKDYMTQYVNCPDPTESAARKERLRLSEELGEIDEVASRMVRANLASHRADQELTPKEVTPERLSAKKRLGTLGDPQSAFARLGARVSPQENNAVTLSLQSAPKRKQNKALARRTTPLSLAMISGSMRRKKAAKAGSASHHRAERNSKNIPRNEENNDLIIPPREENPEATDRVRKVQKDLPTTSKPPRKETSKKRTIRSRTGHDFQNPPSPLP